MDVTQTAVVSVLKATVELDAMTATPDMRGMPQDYAKKVCTILKETQYTRAVGKSRCLLKQEYDHKRRIMKLCMRN